MLQESGGLELVHEDHWLTIRFNRPEKRNALSSDTVTALTSVLDQARDDSTIRGITFRGNGGVFSSGGDLKGFMEAEESADPVATIRDASRDAGELFALIDGMPQVVVMLVEGAAMAGGLGLLCAGDIVITTRDAQFSLTETTLGIPPAQIAPYVVRRLGLRTARRIMLTATRFDGDEALTLGLANEVVDTADELAEKEREIRKAVLRCGPEANAATKEILLSVGQMDTDELIDLAADRFANCMTSQEGREGIAAFLGKRKPDWAR
ncbi:enoyl-CoA hydratase-related protein [Hoeflea sp. CAU 1731]